ncbi:MAG: Thioesterase superfamily protein [Chloroflexi bacterium ADurb.Bin180]|nr:MAG: Thioesterase superfamily protein [Chloroflexi bacterium ADurb.Bin180]
MEKQKNSRGCFLCGRQNPIGLKMSWYNDREAQCITASVTVPEHFNSYPGVVHGGIVAALLDETAGRSILLVDDRDDNLMVTARLEIRYRLPVPTGQPITLRGKTLQYTGTRAKVRAEVLLADGSVAAEAEALLLRPPAELFASWEAEKPYWKVYDD